MLALSKNYSIFSAIKKNLTFSFVSILFAKHAQLALLYSPKSLSSCVTEFFTNDVGDLFLWQNVYISERSDHSFFSLRDWI